jgi:hypothetical protein
LLSTINSGVSHDEETHFPARPRKGKIGIAKPRFGKTAIHAACLFAAWGDEKARTYFRDLIPTDFH